MTDAQPYPLGWTTGPLRRCVTCGRGAVPRDPTGRPRHPWCPEPDEKETAR